jgi:hypothetical protein
MAAEEIAFILHQLAEKEREIERMRLGGMLIIHLSRILA